MIKKIFLIPLLATAVGLSACSTRQIAPASTLIVNPQVQDQAIANNIASTVQSMARHGWVVQKIESNRVVASFNHGARYLQVTYLIQQHQVSSKITDSQYLSQRGDKIHRKALKWKAGLDRRVFQRLASLNLSSNK
ncbi:hypothetical protein [Acinetobacter sp. MD2(2019)]|uniref:hypothetical protein n=1 Tax=Acinetobacter sp. MD2(2019) TaxID=2605273 RepID=UPI002D1F7AAA|nr:hypothetical protein [Acinetobacter sp. MD2(2019)]MEB3753618.1 hypothetical protein [Acinetobacter sp. MD2(2019)]